MVCGGFSFSGHGPLWFMPPNTTINSKVYLRILQDKLKLHMRQRNCSVFQHDGAPCHKAKIVSSWLKQNKISVLDWPGSSPDLNPIENIWTYVKKKVNLRRPSNLYEMKHAIMSVWCLDITPDYCSKLVSSMPKRIKLVLKNKGRSIKY